MLKIDFICRLVVYHSDRSVSQCFSENHHVIIIHIHEVSCIFRNHKFRYFTPGTDHSSLASYFEATFALHVGGLCLLSVKSYI